MINSNKKISLPIGAFIIFLIAIIAGAGILFYQNSQIPENKAKILEKKEKIKELPLEQIIEDKTADWKIYENKDYGIKLKYPNDWKIKEELGSEDSMRVIKNLDIYFLPKEKTEKFYIGLGVGDISILYPMNLNDYVDWYSRAVLSESTIFESKSTIISNLPARKIIFRPKGETEGKVMIILAIKDDLFTYSFMYGTEDEKYSEYISEVEKIIDSIEIYSSPKVEE